MYVIVFDAFDYEDLTFKLKEKDALNVYEEEKQRFDPSIHHQVTLFKLNGDSSINFGQEVEVDGDIEIIHHIDEYDEY